MRVIKRLRAFSVQRRASAANSLRVSGVCAVLAFVAPAHAMPPTPSTPPGHPPIEATEAPDAGIPVVRVNKVMNGLLDRHNDPRPPGSVGATPRSPSSSSAARSSSGPRAARPTPRAGQTSNASRSRTRQASRPRGSRSTRPAATRRAANRSQGTRARSAAQSTTRATPTATAQPQRTASASPPRSGARRGNVTWNANRGCLAANLRAIVYETARRFGSVRVNSTCRSRARNRRVGGASRSWHLTGNAVDLRVFGNIRAAARYLRSAAGGYKHYGGGLFHIDNGPNRTW